LLSPSLANTSTGEYNPNIVADPQAALRINCLIVVLPHLELLHD
jgi:hypothetical protein